MNCDSVSTPAGASNVHANSLSSLTQLAAVCDEMLSACTQSTPTAAAAAAAAVSGSAANPIELDLSSDASEPNNASGHPIELPPNHWSASVAPAELVRLRCTVAGQIADIINESSPQFLPNVPPATRAVAVREKVRTMEARLFADSASPPAYTNHKTLYTRMCAAREAFIRARPTPVPEVGMGELPAAGCVLSSDMCMEHVNHCGDKITVVARKNPLRWSDLAQSALVDESEQPVRDLCAADPIHARRFARFQHNRAEQLQHREAALHNVINDLARDESCMREGVQKLTATVNEYRLRLKNQPMPVSVRTATRKNYHRTLAALAMMKRDLTSLESTLVGMRAQHTRLVQDAERMSAGSRDVSYPSGRLLMTHAKNDLLCEQSGQTRAWFPVPAAAPPKRARRNARAQSAPPATPREVECILCHQLFHLPGEVPVCSHPDNVVKTCIAGEKTYPCEPRQVQCIMCDQSFRIPGKAPACPHPASIGRCIAVEKGYGYKCNYEYDDDSDHCNSSL